MRTLLIPVDSSIGIQSGRGRLECFSTLELIMPASTACVSFSKAITQSRLLVQAMSQGVYKNTRRSPYYIENGLKTGRPRDPHGIT